MEARPRTPWLKYLLSLAVAAALLYVSFRGVKWADLLAALGACRWGFVLLAMAVGALAFLLRALRWRMLLRPIGYIASNAADYSEATAVLEDAIYKRMLQRAVTMGKNSMVIVTGPPASGKSTAVRALQLGGAGLVYDADLSDARRLVDVINLAYTAGMSDVSVVMVYNDLVTCFKNAVNRGHTKWRFTPMDQLVAAYSSNTGNIDLLRAAYPDVAIRPINCAGNGGVRPVSLEEAAKWNYNVDEALMTALLNCAQEMIDNGELRGTDSPAALGDVLSIPQLTDATRPMAQRLDYKVREVQSQWR